jgi:hypothetical protein
MIADKYKTIYGVFINYNLNIVIIANFYFIDRLY